MTSNWHDASATRALLRAVGAVLLVGCGLICTRLAALAQGHAGAEPPAVYLLALAAFLCLAGGGALLFYGHHLFDRVGVSQRWAEIRRLRDE